MRLNLHLSSDPEIPFLDLYPSEKKNFFTQNIMWMFLVSYLNLGMDKHSVMKYFSALTQNALMLYQ